MKQPKRITEKEAQEQAIDKMLSDVLEEDRGSLSWRSSGARAAWDQCE